MTRQIVFTTKAAKPPPTYSQAVKAAGLVFVSGTSPADPATGAINDAGTSTQVGPQIQSLVVESAGPVRSKTIVDKPQPLLGVVLAILLFGIWSAGVAVIPRLVSAWRRYGGRPQLA